MVYLETVAKIAAPIIRAFDPNSVNIKLEVIALLLLHAFYLVNILLSAGSLDHRDTLAKKSLQGIVVLLYEIGLVNIIMGSYSGKEGFYLVSLFIPQALAFLYLSRIRIASLQRVYNLGGSTMIQSENEAELLILHSLNSSTNLLAI